MSVPTTQAGIELPRWDFSNVYPALDSEDYAAGGERMKREIDELDAFLGRALPKAAMDAGAQQVGQVLDEAVQRFNSLYELAGTRQAYINGFVATDSRNALAAKALSVHEQSEMRLEQLGLRFRSWLGSLGAVLEDAISLGGVTQAHAFILREMAAQARYLRLQAAVGLFQALGGDWSAGAATGEAAKLAASVDKIPPSPLPFEALKTE